MNTTPALTKCQAPKCSAEFFLVEARGAVKNLCLDHGDAHMRANGHQNDPLHSVD
jgi:hypothetical protein